MRRLGQLLSPLEWCAVAFAVLVAHGFLLHEWWYPSDYDATIYRMIGREFAEHGLSYRFTAADLRTYGYPFFLSLVQRGASGLSAPLAMAVLEVQLLLYLGAALVLRTALASVWPLAGRLVFCGLLANYYALSYLPQTLTESLSLTLLVFAAACWLMTYRIDAGPWSLVAGSLTVGFAAMVRPPTCSWLAPGSLASWSSSRARSWESAASRGGRSASRSPWPLRRFRSCSTI